MTSSDLLAQFPPKMPGLGLAWTAIVTVATPIDLGPSQGGHRYMVPITGGQFFEGPKGPGLNGKVLPGGADRQFLRGDGIKELEAIYEMRTDEGTILSIENRVLVDASRTPERYAMSTIRVSGPEGSFAWLNRRIFVGTLQSARPQQDAVIIRGWLVDEQGY